MNQETIKLSVALVTRNRPKSLERCLESWRSQTVAPYEIVVSDNSDEPLRGAIMELAHKFDCIYTQAPRIGLAANRNHASFVCNGTHILSADDDHTHPQDYVEKILKMIGTDPKRVWIVTERYRDNPNAPLNCPPELHRSGYGISPKDPSNCTAIADGSSVYPKAIFEQGLRYDESYPFGAMEYLWGKVLVKKGWRISFSDSTFIWHDLHLFHEEKGDRLVDKDWLRSQIECSMYVLFVRALWINFSFCNIFWTCFYLVRRIIFKDSIVSYKVSVRLGWGSVRRILGRAWKAKKLYRRMLT